MYRVLLIIVCFLFISSTAYAGSVHGYFRKNGTYVQPYQRSAPDHTVTNNYSYQGNVNPYTGAVGHNNYVHDRTSPYFNGTPDSSGKIGHGSFLNGASNSDTDSVSE